MLYTATYYERLCIDTEQWYCIEDCIVLATQTHIIDIIPYREYKKKYSSFPLIETQGFHIPAFVNAHTHLDNAYLYGNTNQHKGFYSWLCSVLKERKEEAYKEDYIQQHPSVIHIQDTAFIATIASSQWLHELLCNESIPHYVFYESIGDTALLPEYEYTSSFYRMSYAGHALYSTHSRTLCEVKEYCRRYNIPFSIHLAEHQEEVDFLQGKKNDFSILLQERLMQTYIPPHKSPVEYAYSLGLLDEHTLAVHCVHCNTHDIELLQKSKATVCLCPRSNTYIDVGIAKAQEFFQAGIPLCIATDGLASNTSLSLWEEALYAMKLYTFTLKECIPMMTIQPARILGIDNHFGKMQIGYYPKTTEIPSEYLD